MSVAGMNLADQIGFFGLYLVAKSKQVFLSPGGSFSIAALLTAFLIALAFLAHKHRHRRRLPGPRALLRAIFPRRVLRSRSTRADIGFFAFNIFLAGLLFGWALISAHAVGTFVNEGLRGAFGPLAPTALPDVVCAAIMTVAIFVAYEFGYWLDHYISHKVPFLWEFHKVHHSAEVLTSLTNYRVHPVDSIVYLNIRAAVMGLAGGGLTFLFGKPVAGFTIWDVNALVLIFAYLLEHLHHSQFWIPLTGVWGRIFVSPAHHQIHHSTNPIHFDKNMGGCLAIFDWMFGTLHMPSKEPERLTFGVDGYEGDPHSIAEGLIRPVGRALETLAPASSPAEEGAASRR